VPPVREGYDLDVAVVGRMVAGDSRSPTFWAFSTIGLSNAEQAVNSKRPGFRRFELVLATNNYEKEDPFPARIGVALSMGPEGLPGWDWGQVKNPPLLDWLVIAGEEVGSAIRSGSQFAFADTLTLGPGNSEWTKSQLDHSILLPVCPPLLAAGFDPFGGTAQSGVVHPSEWHIDPGMGRFQDGFVWLLPVSKHECERASKAGSWNLFADLVELSTEAGRGEFGVALDLLRRT
jgi:hypothetical protein